MSGHSSQKSKSIASKKNPRKGRVDLKAQVDLLSVPNETTEDHILLEIRKFIASAIFLNSQAA